MNGHGGRYVAMFSAVGIYGASLAERYWMERTRPESSFRKEASSCPVAALRSRDIAATIPDIERWSTGDVLDDVPDQITSPVLRF